MAAEHRHIKPAKILRKRIKHPSNEQVLLDHQAVFGEKGAHSEILEPTDRVEVQKPVLNQTTTVPPQLLPFQEETVGGKPDAVKRCKESFVS